MVYLPYQGFSQTCCHLWTGTLLRGEKQKRIRRAEKQGRRCRANKVIKKKKKVIEEHHQSHAGKLI